MRPTDYIFDFGGDTPADILKFEHKMEQAGFLLRPITIAESTRFHAYKYERRYRASQEAYDYARCNLAPHNIMGGYPV